MNKMTMAAGAALLASSAMVQAGGIDRSGQSIGAIFEDGNYVELSYGFVSPTVSGQDPFGDDTGDLGSSYSLVSGAYKTDVSDKFSLALIVDQPFGAGAAYPAVGSLYDDVTADLSSTAFTVLASYDISDRFVIYGGGVAQTTSATASLPYAGGYTIDADADTGFGYVVGGAFQIPEYALRVSLTYRSEITTAHDSVEWGAPGFVTDLTTPQSVNLEFQTGINPKTLVFGSVRWVEWSKFSIAPTLLDIQTGQPLVSYDNDVVTYSLGVGRKLSETLSAAVTIGYEAQLGGAPSVLSPTDGYFSVGAGATYKIGDAEITGGVKYIWIGDAANPGVGTFSDNSALAIGFKISYSM